MDGSSDVLKRMELTAERIKEKASISGAAAIETKLNDTTRLHEFLGEEMATYSNYLQGLVEKWETIHTRIGGLTSWMETTEERWRTLEKQETLSIDWVADGKVCLCVFCLARK